MVGLSVPEAYRTIDRLIETGDFSGARERLEALGEQETPGYTLLELKLGLRDGSLLPASVENRVVQLLRLNPDTPGARELYQEASALAFRHGQSSLAHSHPPPPIKEPEKPDR
jgi:hypothetical protein